MCRVRTGDSRLTVRGHRGTRCRGFLVCIISIVGVHWDPLTWGWVGRYTLLFHVVLLTRLVPDDKFHLLRRTNQSWVGYPQT